MQGNFRRTFPKHRSSVELELMDSRLTGLLAETQLIAQFTKIGIMISKPLGVARYDLIIDVGGKLLTVQTKTGSYDGSVITFRCCSRPYDSIGKRSLSVDYRGEVDFFGVYCPELEKCYIVPVNSVGRHAATLRVKSPKNNNKKNIRDASNYFLSTKNLARLLQTVGA